MTNWTGFITLLRRETYRFLRLFRQTLVPPLMTTLLYILVFGVSLGAHIKEIKGFNFIVFILPGLAQLGLITNAYANTSTSLFMARLERSIENLLIAPLSYLHIVLAFILGAVFRGLTVGYATLFIARFFVEFPMPHPVLLFCSWTLSCAFFGALGLASALLAETWDHISLFTNFVITPFIYLGGAFYSVDMLPEFWRKVSQLNPIFYCIDSSRYAVLGISDAPVGLSFAVIGTLAAISIATCTLMVRRGYKLVN